MPDETVRHKGDTEMRSIMLLLLLASIGCNAVDQIKTAGICGFKHGWQRDGGNEWDDAHPFSCEWGSECVEYCCNNVALGLECRR